MHSDWKYFDRKKLDDPAQLDKNTGRYCDKKFHGLSESQEIVERKNEFHGSNILCNRPIKTINWDYSSNQKV